jgi:23S rRNA (guanine745-N1)-methyltransferase
LNKDYYAPLRNALQSLALQLTGDAPTVLDTGCGEGYYTSGIYRALCAAGKQVQMAGTDISKFILKRAAKREKSIEFAVASSYHLPIGDTSIDLLINCFSPLALEEFRRVLCSGGHFVYVVPSERHLWQLKEVLYEAPRPNEVKLTPYEGFRYVDVLEVRDSITLESPEDIFALFQMTPYSWKTPEEGVNRLKELTTLTTEIAFHIHLFEKE